MRTKARSPRPGQRVGPYPGARDFLLTIDTIGIAGQSVNARVAIERHAQSQ